MPSSLKSGTRGALIGLLCTGLVALSSPVRAEMIGTESAIQAQSRSSDLAMVQTFMSRDAVRAELERYGVTADAASERVAALSDTELRALAGNIEQQPAGAGVVAVVGITFLVLLILELVGVIDIFKRI
jgi:hypothetical protein